jgi:hypothetical protein
LLPLKALLVLKEPLHLQFLDGSLTIGYAGLLGQIKPSSIGTALLSELFKLQSELILEAAKVFPTADKRCTRKYSSCRIMYDSYGN